MIYKIDFLTFKVLDAGASFKPAQVREIVHEAGVMEKKGG
jgi:hypothetical protein